MEKDGKKEEEPKEKTRLRRFLREKDLKKHLKGKTSIGDIEQKSEEETADEAAEAAEDVINEYLLKDNQFQQAVSLLSGWEVMKKMFKNLKVTTPNTNSQISMK